MIEWNKKAWLHKNYIYIMKIKTINVGSNTHDIRLGRIYFHSTILIRYFVLTDEVSGDF